MVGLSAMAGLYFISTRNYLLFHSVAEVFSIVIACGIFMFARSARRFIDNGYLRLLGTAYLFIGIFDSLHMLAYKGMGVFQDQGGNVAIQLWIAARFMESLSFLAASAALKRKPKDSILVVCYLVLTGVLLGAIFWVPVFPECYADGQGLTPFKKQSEYVICGILLVSLWQLHRNRQGFSDPVLKLLATSLVTTIVAELAFTFYVGVYDLSNLIGHLLKVISFYLIYKAIIETGLARPYDLLFTELQRQKSDLETANRQMVDELEHARRTQTALLPQAPPTLPECRIVAKYVPMNEVGGDLYDFLSLGNGRVGIMMADVVGHGVGAALIASMVSTLFRTMAPEHQTLRALLESANNALVEKLPSESFVTAFLCSYDPDRRSLQYASAGHLEAYVVRKSPSEVIPIQAPGIALGLAVTAGREWGEGHIPLQSGDKVLLYTDGLTEARDLQGARFEHQRLKSVLGRAATLDVQEMVDATYASVVTFAGRDTFGDDIAMVGLEVL